MTRDNVHLNLSLGLAILLAAVVVNAFSRMGVPGSPERVALRTPRPMPTATVAATPGWWGAVEFATPELAGLPGLPAVSLDENGRADGAGPVPFTRISCPGPVHIAAIIADGLWWRISGTAQTEPFGYWKVELSADGRGWTVLHRSEQPVAAGHLMDFRTDTVPSGSYHLRLTAVRRDGNYPPPCEVTVGV